MSLIVEKSHSFDEIQNGSLDQIKEDYKARREKYRGRRFAHFKSTFSKFEREYNQEHDISIKKMMAIASGTGTATGIVLGGITGGCCGSLGGPPGIVGGIIVGGAIGGVIGLGIGGTVAYCEYRKYLKTKDGQWLIKQLLPIMSEDPKLEDCLCAINHDIPVDAVRTPTGHVYEKEIIMQWIHDRGTDPMSRKNLTENDLVPAYDVAPKTLRAMISVLENNNFEERENKNFFKNSKEKLEKILDSMHDSDVKNLRREKTEGKITSLEFGNKILEINNVYYN